MKGFWIGWTVGVLVGGVAVSLLVPQSGRSTRKKIRRGLEDFGDDLSEAAEYLKEQAERLSKDTQKWMGNSKDQKRALDEVVDTVRSVTGSARAKVTGSRLM